jgi:hypothetical protein
VLQVSDLQVFKGLLVFRELRVFRVLRVSDLQVFKELLE